MQLNLRTPSLPCWRYGGSPLGLHSTRDPYWGAYHQPDCN